MAKLKKILRSPITTIAMFAVAIGLLLTGTIGGARALQRVETQVYQSRVQTQDIGITIVENKEEVGWRKYVRKEDGTADGSWSEQKAELLQNMVPEGEVFTLGVRYPEVVSVKNSGNIDSFVRVTIYKYFAVIDEKGNEVKLTELDPSLIHLNLVNTDSTWIIDEDKYSETEERIVLYYSKALEVEEETDPFIDQVWVDNSLATMVTKEYDKVEDGVNYHVFEAVYDYDGIRFYVEIQVDAVQTHNAEAAILSSWGRAVKIDGNTLSLAD